MLGHGQAQGLTKGGAQASAQASADSRPSHGGRHPHRGPRGARADDPGDPREVDEHGGAGDAEEGHAVVAREKIGDEGLPHVVVEDGGQVGGAAQHPEITEAHRGDGAPVDDDGGEGVDREEGDEEERDEEREQTQERK